MIAFKVAYWVAMLLEIVIRAPYQKTAKTAARADHRVSPTENLLLSLLTIGSLVLPLIYSVTNWLNFADYTLPAWMGWFGVVVLACSVFVFGRAHADLKSNWSPSLEIYEGHTLVTDGIYRYIRHPMYTSLLLWSIAQILLMQNWLAGPPGLIVFVPFYLLRVRAEEKMLLGTFGNRYREYMQKVGGIFPRSPG